MRILFLSERFPFPLFDGGNLRTFHLLRGLARDHEVTLVAHHPQEDTLHAKASVANVCRVFTVQRPSHITTIARVALRSGLRAESLFATKNWSPRLLGKARSLLRNESFDAIHFNHLDTAYYSLGSDWPQLKVFDTHNCLSEMAAQIYKDSASYSKRFVASLEVKRLKTAEANVCRKMNAVLACSDEEATQFRKLSAKNNVSTVPNGVDCEYFRRTQESSVEAGAMVFVGSMGYYPNQDAALYFCREVLPTLRNLTPPPKIYIVGRDPPSSLLALHNGTDIIITGMVDDVRTYLERAMVVIVPLRHGAGTRLKILEAFAMGKPVVSTVKGAEGIPATDGTEILLAAGTNDLVSQLRKVWNSVGLREALGNAAQGLARSKFDWTIIGEQVRAVYRGLADKRVPVVSL
jgi:glycosyltransferase involved in cell wall biosynthesis